jgi:hypothetical protein
VIPKAAIVATDISTGIAKNIASGSDGSYLIRTFWPAPTTSGLPRPAVRRRYIPACSEDRRVHPRRPGHHAAARLGRERFHPITATIRNGQPMFLGDPWCG